jgi:hypothetical protein
MKEIEKQKSDYYEPIWPAHSVRCKVYMRNEWTNGFWLAEAGQTIIALILPHQIED